MGNYNEKKNARETRGVVKKKVRELARMGKWAREGVSVHASRMEKGVKWREGWQKGILTWLDGVQRFQPADSNGRRAASREWGLQPEWRLPIPPLRSSAHTLSLSVQAARKTELLVRAKRENISLNHAFFFRERESTFILSTCCCCCCYFTIWLISNFSRLVGRSHYESFSALLATFTRDCNRLIEQNSQLTLDNPLLASLKIGKSSRERERRIFSRLGGLKREEGGENTSEQYI